MERTTEIHHDQVALPQEGWVSRLPLVGGGVGVVGLGASIALGLGDPRQFFFSWLVAFLFFLTIALGGLFFVLVQFLTRAGWSVVVRRLAEHLAATLPLFAVLFVPIAIGLHDLYHWTHEDAVAADRLLQHKSAWLNTGFFLGRAVLVLAVWGILGWWVWHQSRRQDQLGAVAITRKLQTRSAPALILFGLTVTVAAVDWIMSLDPHWYSTMFGVYFFSGIAVACFASLILMVLVLQRGGALRGVVTDEHFHDLGKLLFGFVVFWAYIAFSQFMLIWYANIPEETLWYAHRWDHGWRPLSVALALGHFVVPFFFLMPRDVKRHRVALWVGSLWLLAMHYLDLFWLVMPVLHGEHAAVHLLDFTAPLAVGGLFLAYLGLLMRRKVLIPIHDPRLSESLAFENV